MSDFTNRDKTPGKPADRESSSRVHSADTERIANALSYKFDVLKAVGADRDCEYYQAREVLQDSMTGLRVLSANRARDVVKRELFYLESYAASKLSHLNIVKFGRPEEIDGIHFTTFEYNQEASTLRDLL